MPCEKYHDPLGRSFPLCGEGKLFQIRYLVRFVATSIFFMSMLLVHDFLRTLLFLCEPLVLYFPPDEIASLMGIAWQTEVKGL